MSPIVSICIANYNGIDLIDACIASVRAQDCAFPVEIIVHDDASQDGSVALIRARHPDVRLIEGPENVGFCIANNRMAAIAHGEYLLLLNNDAELLPDALRVLHLEAERLDRPAILSLPQFDFETRELIDRGCLLDPFFNPVPNLDPTRHEVAMVIGACLWIPKTLWDELDGFPEWFGSIAEDMYLCCVARLADHPVRASESSGYQHRVGATFGGGKPTQDRSLVTTARRRRLSERNKCFVLILTCPAPYFYLLLPLHLILLTIEGMLLALAKNDWHIFENIYLDCLRQLWQARSRLITKRESIQAARKITAGQYFHVFLSRHHKINLLFKHGLPHVKR